MSRSTPARCARRTTGRERSSPDLSVALQSPPPRSAADAEVPGLLRIRAADNPDPSRIRKALLRTTRIQAGQDTAKARPKEDKGRRLDRSVPVGLGGFSTYFRFHAASWTVRTARRTYRCVPCIQEARPPDSLTNPCRIQQPENISHTRIFIIVTNNDRNRIINLVSFTRRPAVKPVDNANFTKSAVEFKLLLVY